MPQRAVPVVLIGRFSTYAGVGTFQSLPVAVTDFDSAEIGVWRGKMQADTTFDLKLEASLDRESWIELASSDPGADSETLHVVSLGAQARQQGLLLAEQLRETLPALRVLTHCGDGSFKSQFKKADRSGARYALVLGEQELQRREAGLKPLREHAEQQTVAFDALGGILPGLLGLES